MQIDNECTIVECPCFIGCRVGSRNEHSITLLVDEWKNPKMEYAKCQQNKTEETN